MSNTPFEFTEPPPKPPMGKKATRETRPVQETVDQSAGMGAAAPGEMNASGTVTALKIVGGINLVVGPLLMTGGIFLGNGWTTLSGWLLVNLTFVLWGLSEITDAVLKGTNREGG